MTEENTNNNTESQAKQRKSFKNTKHYINNKELMDEVLLSQRLGYVTDRLAEFFMLMSERNSQHRFFVRYPYREDLIGDGILACMKAWTSFDPDRSDNPLAYFTSCIHNQFKQRIKKEYYQKNVTDSIMVDKGLNPSYGFEEAQEAIERKRNKNKLSDEEAPVEDDGEES